MTSNISLSPHFKLSEFTASRAAAKHGIANIPPEEAVANLRRLCEGCLEPLREALGLPIIITSGYRTRELNSLLAHSSDHSQHMLGQAADLYVGLGPEVQEVKSSRVKGSWTSQAAKPSAKVQSPSHRELLIKAFREILTNPKIDFDQLILYPTFIHVSYVSKEKNRHGILQAQGNGKLGYGRLTRADALLIV